MDNDIKNAFETQYDINNNIADALKILGDQITWLFIWNVILTICLILLSAYVLR